MNHSALFFRYVLVIGLVLLNLYWLWLAFDLQQHDETSVAAETANTEQAEPPKPQPVTIEVAAAMPEPAPEPAATPEPPAPNTNTPPAEQLAERAPAQKESQQNEPQLIGQVMVDYPSLERMVRQQGGAIYLYDLNRRQPVRMISHGVLVAIPSSHTALSPLSHNLTKQLDRQLVNSWIAEERRLSPEGHFVVVAKFPDAFQTGFEQFAKAQAAQARITYSDIDEVQFSFTADGLLLRQFLSKGRAIPVNTPFPT